MCREDVPLFCFSFSELLYFCVGFFQFTDAFFGSILLIFAYFFAAYYVYFIKKSNSVYYVYLVKKSNSVLGTTFS